MASILRTPLPPKATEKPLPQFELGPLPPPEHTESVAARSAAPPAANKAARGPLDTPSGSLAWATRLENAALGRLSPQLRERVGQHRSAVLAGACLVGASLLLMLGLGAHALVGGSHARAPRAASTTTDIPSRAATISAPVRSATHVANAPAAPNSDEPTLLLTLAQSLLEQHRAADVPTLAARLVARHPELVNDERLKHVVLEAAAASDPRAANEAFALLTGPMGETGAGLVYELSLKQDLGRSVRVRAQSYLASKDFERVASLPVFAAEKLRSAKTCEDKRALLDFAGQVGGTQVIQYLNELAHQTACGPDDLEHCYPCLATDHRLTDTLSRLSH